MAELDALDEDMMLEEPTAEGPSYLQVIAAGVEGFLGPAFSCCCPLRYMVITDATGKASDGMSRRPVGVSREALLRNGKPMPALVLATPCWARWSLIWCSLCKKPRRAAEVIGGPGSACTGVHRQVAEQIPTMPWPPDSPLFASPSAGPPGQGSSLWPCQLRPVACSPCWSHAWPPWCSLRLHHIGDLCRSLSFQNCLRLPQQHALSTSWACQLHRRLETHQTNTTGKPLTLQAGGPSSGRICVQFHACD